MVPALYGMQEGWDGQALSYSDSSLNARLTGHYVSLS